jgi:hypothetical protein
MSRGRGNQQTAVREFGSICYVGFVVTTRRDFRIVFANQSEPWWAKEKATAMDEQRCTNLNHARHDAPVRACPSCGDVVNARLPRGSCSQGTHATRRRNREAFCSDCGLRLRENGLGRN